MHGGFKKKKKKTDSVETLLEDTRHQPEKTTEAVTPQAKIGL